MITCFCLFLFCVFFTDTTKANEQVVERSSSKLVERSLRIVEHSTLFFFAWHRRHSMDHWWTLDDARRTLGTRHPVALVVYCLAEPYCGSCRLCSTLLLAPRSSLLSIMQGCGQVMEPIVVQFGNGWILRPPVGSAKHIITFHASLTMVFHC